MTLSVNERLKASGIKSQVDVVLVLVIALIIRIKNNYERQLLDGSREILKK